MKSEDLEDALTAIQAGGEPIFFICHASEPSSRAAQGLELIVG